MGLGLEVPFGTSLKALGHELSVSECTELPGTNSTV